MAESMAAATSVLQSSKFADQSGTNSYYAEVAKPPIRVGFNGRLLTDGSLRGWNRYTINLVTHLPAHGVQPVIFSNAPLSAAHLPRLAAAGCEIVVGGPRRVILWEQAWFPRAARRARCHLLHATFNFGLPVFARLPRILTLHDAIDVMYYRARSPRRRLPRSFGDMYARLAPWLSRVVARHVITVSEHAKQDLCHAYGLAPERVTAIHEAADPRFQRPDDSELHETITRLQLNQPYFFYVGGLEDRKNVALLMRAYAAADVDADLVLAGGKPAEQQSLAELAAKLGVGERVRFLGWVDDADLPACYAGSLVFIYPSEYEGFGLQLCEAMACGCPVLAANSTSLPEVLGRGGQLFEQNDIKRLSDLLVRVAEDVSYRRNLVERASHRALDFSWLTTAEETRRIYDRI